MKKSLMLAAVAIHAAALVAAPAAHASPELAKAKACMACHTVSSKLVGPGYKEVAAKYAKDAGAEARLVQKIQKGSSGTWGPVPMPANPGVTDAEAKTLAKWILSQK